MAKITQTKEQADTFIDSIFESQEENEKELKKKHTQELSEISDNLANNLPYTAPETNISDDEYLDLSTKPRTFETENPQRERLVKKIKEIYSKPARSNSQPVRSREEDSGDYGRPNPRPSYVPIHPLSSPTSKPIKQIDFDLFFKIAVIILLSILLIMVGSGKLKSEVNTDIQLNQSEQVLNVNTNNTNPTTNTFYNNFSETSAHTTNVNINATLQLPKEVLDDLKKIANMTNSS